MQETLDVSNEVAAELAGMGDGVLEALRDRLDCTIRLRGNQLTLEGDDKQVGEAREVIEELVELVEGGHQIGSHTVDAVLGALEAEQDVRDVFDDVVWRHRGKHIAPKTVTQKAYVDAIRRGTITFGIGPAGTGKTYLAMALAVAALHERQVARIILTRPAVEAGERLGFLPGDMLAKVDPYLRPLFDALYDMLDPERANTYMERGTIEVAPLAFMRGRAQPVSTPVLTPDGFRPIGTLRVGDLVYGSDGMPTLVLGVYPQGRKEIFRVTAQDGSSTLCCAEHLWQVRTAEGEHVLTTGEMLADFPSRRYELPLLSAPVELEPHDVPVDPYLLGISLAGEGVPNRRGRIGTRTVLQMTTTSLRKRYIHNSSDVRVALLQGLLDSNAARVIPEGGTCSIQYATPSERVRADISWLVRSLGGVANAAGRSALEIRLPAGIEPFRLRRKAEIYRAHGGRRPMRFIESIEPAGEAECVCIQVGAADSLYVTEDFLVTHNTLNDSFIILDEAQNTSPEQMQMFLTRLGFGSRIVITGDVTQIDLPRDQASGLIQVQDILEEIEGISFIRFGHQDVVRHKLVQRIVEAYREHAEETGTERRR